MKPQVLIFIFFIITTSSQQDTSINYQDLPYAISNSITKPSSNITQFFGFTQNNVNAWFDGCSTDFISYVSSLQSGIVNNITNYAENIAIDAGNEYNNYLSKCVNYTNILLQYENASDSCRQSMIDYFSSPSLRNSYINCITDVKNDAISHFQNFSSLLDQIDSDCNTVTNIDVQTNEFILWLKNSTNSFEKCVSDANITYTIAEVVIRYELQTNCISPTTTTSQAVSSRKTRTPRTKTTTDSPLTNEEYNELVNYLKENGVNLNMSSTATDTTLRRRTRKLRRTTTTTSPTTSVLSVEEYNQLIEYMKANNVTIPANV